MMTGALRHAVRSHDRATEGLQQADGTPVRRERLAAPGPVTCLFMKVLHVSSGRLSGGIDTMLLTLASERGVCPAMQPAFAVCFDQGRLAQRLRSTGVPVHSLGPVRARYPWQILRARARLRRLLAAERFDAVVSHSSWIHALLGGVVRERGRPLVFWMHNKATREGMNLIERCAGRLLPDLVVCNSRFTADTLPVLFGERLPPSEVIHCPVAPPAMPTHDANRRALVRKKLGTSAEDVVIIQIGWMEPCKGHDLHLAALQRLRDLPGWTCWIVGGAETRLQSKHLARMQKLSMENGLSQRVRFLGQRRDVSTLLAAADIFCQPNADPEAFGIVFVEALQFGVPVVSFRHGGVTEIVDESCARLVPPGDSEALAQTLRTLIVDPALRMKLAGAAPQRAAKISSPVHTLHRVHDVFEAFATGTAHGTGVS